MGKKFELLKCLLPNKFVAGSIVANLQHLGRNFATSLKQQRQVIHVEILVGSLDVKENTREKDA